MANIFEDGFVDTSQHVYRDFSVPNTDPFGVSIFANTNSNGVPTSYSYSFNQAYAFNAAISGDLSRASGVISGMDESFTVPVGEDIEFKVGLKINKQNFIIQDAVFYTGAPSQEGEDLSSGLYPIFAYKSEDNDAGKVYTGIYQVCTVRDGSVITRTLRDNIYLDNIQIKQLGTTGAPTNGVGGQVHLIQESGQYDSSVPILFRGISGGSGVQVTYDSTNASGGNFIVIDSTGAAGGVGSCANVGDAADVYVEGTSGPFNFRSLTGAHKDTNYPSAGDKADVYVSVDGNEIQFYSEQWNGQNVGLAGEPIFLNGNGTFNSKASFKKIQSSDSSISVGNTTGTVDLKATLQSTTDGGQSTTNKVGVGTDGTYVPSNYLEIYGTTKIQNRTTATDGTLQFGNQAASNITYSHTDSAIQFGENVTELQFIDGSAVGIGSSNSVSLGGIDNTPY